MPASCARKSFATSIQGAGLSIGLASLALLIAPRAVHDATATNDTRTLTFHHTHSEEDLTVTFKRDGRYDEAALKKINHFLRDWRSQDETVMDRKLFDILWEVYRDVGGKQPIQIISAYRAPATNAMLRRRSSGVARHSLHTRGQAMDFFIPGVSLEQIRVAGLRMQRGGVGFYPSSGSPFVHLDTGNVRHWPRMTYDQLARVFPDGRTVHLPTSGTPLRGYDLAAADIEKRERDGGTASTPSGRSFLASLFSRKQAGNDDDEESSAGTAATPAAKPVAVAAADASAVSGPIPMPRGKPVAKIAADKIAADKAAFQLASAASSPAKAPDANKPQTPADIINARGFWGDAPAAPPKQATPQQVAALAARNAFASADRDATASVNPNDRALAYAPPMPVVDRSQIVAASAPIPRSVRPASLSQPVSNGFATIVSKGQQRQPGTVATSTRLVTANLNEVWTRAMILAPSLSTAMSATIMGDPDMTQLRAQFVKPRMAVAMTFSNDPHAGIVCERFSGSAVATLETMSFVVRTASLR
ncbi:MAG: ATP-binding protein [Proteobacteria bacterium SG_bin9]|nr:MAG: ATP-binding protein [Proteobacteria bacterium SG_bin9]